MRVLHAIRRLAISAGVAGVLLLAGCGVAMANALPVRICGSNALAPGNWYTGDPGDGLTSTAAPGLPASVDCPDGTGLVLQATSTNIPHGASAGFKVTAPPGIVINSIHVVGAGSTGVDDGKGWYGWFYWNGGPGTAGNAGGNSLNDQSFNAGGCCSQSNLNSQSIGWFMACGWSSCSNLGLVDVPELDLTAEEDRGPDLLATGTDNLWYQQGWVRGSWQAGLRATDPSGVCGAHVVFGSLPAPFTGTAEVPDRSKWKQCNDQTVSASVDTRTSQGSLGLGEGTMPLTLSADNAARVHSETSKTVYVDNTTPSISLSGPTDAPSTAGTQYVSATAGGSPSGISQISCTTDNGAAQLFSGSSAQVPVSGVGQHTVRCSAADNAVDPAGNHGWSTPASRTVKIGYPTQLWISFSKLVGLRCHRTLVRRHGHLVKVMSCRPRTVRRRTIVWVTVHRHGRLARVKRVRYVRVVVPPRVVSNSARRVPFGRSTTVSGWLGTAGGTALAGLPVQVLVAPDDGSNRFTQAVTVTTSANGTWTALLPAGPSRVIEAVYGGSETTEPAVSADARVTVPARVLLRVMPSRVAWGSRIRISGRILGGYIPANQTAVSQLLRLRIGVQGISQTAGIPDVTRDGRFHTTYCFSSGRGVAHFWFSVSTLNETDYPFAPSGSKRAGVTVGPHNAGRPC
jgi:hypothetical protein